MQENRITSVTASSSETVPSSGSEKGDVTSNTTTSTSNANDIDQAQFEADKRSVYKWVFLLGFKLFGVLWFNAFFYEIRLVLPPIYNPTNIQFHLSLPKIT